MELAITQTIINIDIPRLIFASMNNTDYQICCFNYIIGFCFLLSKINASLSLIVLLVYSYYNVFLLTAPKIIRYAITDRDNRHFILKDKKHG